VAAELRSSSIGFGFAALMLTGLVGLGGLTLPPQDDPPGPQPPATDISPSVPPDAAGPVTPAPVKRPPARDCRVTCLPDVG